MLFSATSFARHVATATAPPSVRRTRRAAATENFVASPGPARAGTCGGTGGEGDDGGLTRVTRVASPEIERSVPVRIVVRWRIFLSVLVRVRRLAPAGAVERDREGGRLSRRHVDRALIVTALLVPRSHDGASRSDSREHRVSVRTGLSPDRAVDHQEIRGHLRVDVAVDADEPGVVERHRARGAVAVEAEVER